MVDRHRAHILRNSKAAKSLEGLVAQAKELGKFNVSVGPRLPVVGL
jgi:hypothetical protein